MTFDYEAVHGIPIKLTGRGESIVAALRATAPTTVPKPPRVVWRCLKYLVIWLVATSVAVLIGFQYDPGHLGIAHVSPRVAIPAGLIVALAITAVVLWHISGIVRSGRGDFLPDGPMFVLSAREWTLFDQLARDDLDVRFATHVWTEHGGGVFGHDQLVAILRVIDEDVLTLERRQLAAQLRSRLGASVAIGAVLSVVTFASNAFLVPSSIQPNDLAPYALVITVIVAPWDVVFQLLWNTLQQRHRSAATPE